MTKGFSPMIGIQNPTQNISHPSSLFDYPWLILETCLRITAARSGVQLRLIAVFILPHAEVLRLTSSEYTEKQVLSQYWQSRVI